MPRRFAGRFEAPDAPCSRRDGVRVEEKA